MFSIEENVSLKDLGEMKMKNDWKKRMIDWLELHIDDITEVTIVDKERVDFKVNGKTKSILVIQKIRR
mgnify:FL=1|tara:strand:+ start:257 stop:460 length:204 start_codon:yes stop_codon:yes gene_type:complete